MAGDDKPMPELEISLGARLRDLRRERALSQRELAELASLSPNGVSLIERDEISPSVATLQRLAGALGVRMSYFFDRPTQARVLHVRAGDRPRVRSAGLTIEGLGMHLTDQQMEPFLVTLAPRTHMGTGQVAHPGHEFVCCLAGRVEYEIDGTSYELEPGDFLLFEADLPHRWGNPGDEETRVLLVLQSPAGAQEPAQRHFVDLPSVTYMR